ncbi:hypothetical protein [Acrocarpospora catenulata]|uniref:hypothetical protein n=1 Tax=Acrocarpospora catenulata TaxID=2836182 RepID=UPI001BDA519E|nr:hypothetical protein [Acrocarpospora catenulata]
MGISLGLLWAGCPAPAASEPVPDFSLEVSPTRLTIPAGKASTAQEFQLINKGRAAFDVTVEKADFTTGEDGSLRFQPQAPFAAAAWARVEPSSLRVEPGTTRKVTLRVDVPPAPEPGDHQFAVIFKVPAGDNGSNIRINRGVAAPVFVAVPGAVDTSAEIAGLTAPEYVLGGPVPITARIRSLGTVHRDFRGAGRLQAQVGGESVAFPDFTVVRGATREVTTLWDPPLVCFCDVTVAVDTPGPGVRSATVPIIVFPLHLAMILVVVLLTLLLAGWLVRRRRRAKATAAALNGMTDTIHA